MPNPGKQDTGYKVQEVPLTVRDHLDPDKHWIGESLGVPTQTEIASTVGSLSSPGDSPFVARADHIHKLGAGVVQNSNLADNAVTSAKIADGTISQIDLADTGWTTFATVSNWSGDPLIRRTAGFVYLSYTPSRDVAGGPANMVPFTIPSGYRPTVVIRDLAQVTAPSATVRVQIATDGTFTIFNATFNAGGFLMGSASWPI